MGGGGVIHSLNNSAFPPDEYKPLAKITPMIIAIINHYYIFLFLGSGGGGDSKLR